MCSSAVSEPLVDWRQPPPPPYSVVHLSNAIGETIQEYKGFVGLFINKEKKALHNKLLSSGSSG